MKNENEIEIDLCINCKHHRNLHHSLKGIGRDMIGEYSKCVATREPNSITGRNEEYCDKVRGTDVKCEYYEEKPKPKPKKKWYHFWR